MDQCIKNVWDILLNLIFKDDAIIKCKFDVHHNFIARRDHQYDIKIFIHCNGPNVPESDLNTSFYSKMYGN